MIVPRVDALVKKEKGGVRLFDKNEGPGKVKSIVSTTPRHLMA